MTEPINLQLGGIVRRSAINFGPVGGGMILAGPGVTIERLDGQDGTDERLQRWESYITLDETPAYGTYENRVPEYQIAAVELFRMGLCDDELIVDVGAGSCDFDHFVRTKAGWRGRLLSVDGATMGVDLEVWRPQTAADWFVCLETLEHLHDWRSMAVALQEKARLGVVVTTPNAETVDVLSTDSTHVSPIHREELEELGFTVDWADLNPHQGEKSTLVARWCAPGNQMPTPASQWDRAGVSATDGDESRDHSPLPSAAEPMAATSTATSPPPEVRSAGRSG